jgi:hypothetical protein
MIPHRPFIHSLTLVKQGRTYGWLSPAEVPASSPQDVRFAAPIDLRGRFNDVYCLEVFEYAPNNGLVSTWKHEVLRDTTDALKVIIAERLLVLRTKTRASRSRSFTYVGKYQHPDFLFRLVEVEPEPPALVDGLFLSTRRVLIGCDPAEHYGGWTDRGERTTVTRQDYRRNWEHGL